MRVLLVLVALVLAGCTNGGDPPSDPLDQGSVTPPPQDEGASSAPPPSSPPPSTPPSTPPSSPPPSDPTPPPGPATPPPAARPADAWTNRSGWVGAPAAPNAGTTVKLPFLVATGATNLTAAAVVHTTYPAEPPSDVPDRPVVFNLTLLDPEGRVVANASYVHAATSDVALPGAPGAPIHLNRTQLRAGEYSLVVVMTGAASDGSSVGDRFSIWVHVSYA